MDLLKNETTARLDDVTRLADETFDLYRDLVDRLEDETLRAALNDKLREQRHLVEKLERARRSRDDLPQGGDAERGHVLAVLATVRNLIMADDTPLIEQIATANDDLAAAATAALAGGVPEDERVPLERIIKSCRAIEAQLVDPR